MRNIHFSDTEIEEVLDCVVAVLNLGNVGFGVIAAKGGDQVASPSIETKDYLVAAGKLLRIDLKTLVAAMTKKRTTVGREVIDSNLNLDQAYQARDALAKHLYCEMFSWLVKKVNAAISQNMTEVKKEEKKAPKGRPPMTKKALNFIGLLDIFGFEIFDSNSFEQLCINYANEKLQQQFN
jgi:myosin heavy subunit